MDIVDTCINQDVSGIHTNDYCPSYVILLMALFVFVLIGMHYSPDELVVPKEDPIVQEISDVLREWGSIWKRLYAVSPFVFVE